MRFKSILTVGILAVAVFAFLVPGSAYHFGTVWDESNSSGIPNDSIYLTDEFERGIQTRNVYFRWNRYEESANNAWNIAYMDQKKQEIKYFQNAGFEIVLRVNPFPVPTWYFGAGNARFKNEHGEEWEPDVFVPALMIQVASDNGLTLPDDIEEVKQIMKAQYHVDDKEADNSQASIWGLNYEIQVREYIQQVLTQLDADPDITVNNFWAIYLSTGQFGEVAFPGRNPVKRSSRYNGASMPPPNPGHPDYQDGLGIDYYRNWNSYWAYDTDAQASCPVPGWQPATQAGLGQRMVNGGFEDTLYTNTIANWESSRACHNQGAWNPVVIEDAGQAQEGSRFLRYASPSGAQYSIRQDVPIRASTNYDLSGHIRAVGGETGYIKLSQLNAVGSVVGTSTLLSSTQSTWTQVIQNFTSEANAAYARVDLYLVGGAGTVDFDAISVLDTANPTADHSQAQQFIDWYYGALTNAVKWQIQEIRERYSGRLILMGGGDATRPGAIEAEINNDLSGMTKDAYWVCRGFVPDRYLQALETDVAVNMSNIYFANTGMEVVWNDWENPGRDSGEIAWNNSPLRSDWSAPKYYAEIASNILNSSWGGTDKLYGENGGLNNINQMKDVFQNMSDFGYEGLGWYTLGQLFEPYHSANIKEYADLITAYNMLPAKPTTGIGIDPIATCMEWHEPKIYDNVILSRNNVESFNSAEYGNPLCTIASQDGSGNTIPAYTGSNYIVVAGKVSDTGNAAYCYHWLMNDVLQQYHNIKIEAGMKLQYHIAHVDDGGNPSDGNRCVGIDFMYTEQGADPKDPLQWKYLRNTGLVDRAGVPVHPNSRHHAGNPANTWNEVIIDLDTLVNATIHQIYVVFDDPTPGSHGAYYRAYIDDLSFEKAPGYDEQFDGTSGEKPFRWRDHFDPGGDNDASIILDGSGGATISIADTKTYGDVFTPILCWDDPSINNDLEINISSITSNTYLDVYIEKEHGVHEERQVLWGISSTGSRHVNLTDFIGADDFSAFSLKIRIVDFTSPGKNAKLNYISLKPMPTVAPTAAGYIELFNGTTGERPSGWRDRIEWPQDNARILNTGNSQATIYLDAAQNHGDVLSPIIAGLDDSIHSQLQIKLDVLNGDNIGVQLIEEKAGGSTHNLGTITGTDIWSYDLNDLPASKDLSRFSIKLWINGTAGVSTAVINTIRISKPVPAEIQYSTYHGGSGDEEIHDVHVGEDGNIYTVGFTTSPDMYTQGVGIDSTHSGSKDGFVRKTDPDGNIIYCTYLGGTDVDEVHSIIANSSGEAFISGQTWSSRTTEDFHYVPASGVFQTELNGGRDAFVAKLDANGAVIYCSYLGGSGWEYGLTVGWENTSPNMVYIGGFTDSTNFPTTTDAAQENYQGREDGFVTKLNLTTSTLEYSTRIGGGESDGVHVITVKNGYAFATGNTQSPGDQFPITDGAVIDNVNYVPGHDQGADGFLTKISLDGKDFLYSSFIGPEDSPSITQFYDITLDDDGNVYLAGSTSEANFSTLPHDYVAPVESDLRDTPSNGYGGGAYDGVIVKLDSSYSSYGALAYYAYIGGSGHDVCTGIKIDKTGDKNMWISGYTDSTGFIGNGNGGTDAFVAYLTRDGQLIRDAGGTNKMAYRVGGSSNEGTQVTVGIDVISGNKLLLGSLTASAEDFPVTIDAAQIVYGGGNKDAFITQYHQLAYTQPGAYPAPPPAENRWQDEFDGTPGEEVEKWYDATKNSAYNAEIAYSYRGSASAITRTASDTWGKVLSPSMNADVDIYPMVEVTILEISPDTTWKVGIQEKGDAWNEWIVSGSSSATGTFSFNYQTVTGWTGTHAFNVVIIIEGGPGKYVVADNIGTTQFIPTPTPTATPTFTVTSTPTVTPTPIPSEINYSTFYGGFLEEKVMDVAIDNTGNIYVVGMTQSDNLPVNGYDTSFNGGEDGFVVKLSPDGQTILYCTYLGGAGIDSVNGITVDDQGNAYLVGSTWSTDFPVTLTTYDTTLDGGRDAFIAKLDTTGQNLLYGTYLGGGSWDYGNTIALDGSNTTSAYVGGFTHGSFPVTSGAAQETFGGMGDAYVTKLNLMTHSLEYSTYLGGVYYEPVDAIYVRNGQAYMTGHTQSPNFPVTQDALDSTNSVPGANQGADGYFTKLSADGSTFLYSTFIGPEQSPQTTLFREITVDNIGNVYLVGDTRETGFVTTQDCIQSTYGGGSGDGIVVKLNNTYSAMSFSTFLGGDGLDICTDVKLDNSGNLYVIGYTDSTAFPESAAGFGGTDIFTVYMDTFGRLLWSNRFGGSNGDGEANYMFKAAVSEPSNELYIAGSTNSTDFPTTTTGVQTMFGGGNHDGFLSILDEPSYTPPPTMTATVTPTSTHSPTPTPTPTPSVPVPPEMTYSTYLGGSGGEIIQDQTIDASGNIYIIGDTSSSDLPVSANAFDTTFNGVNDGFAIKLSPDGKTILYCTYLGGSAHDSAVGIKVDGSGNAYIAGLTFSSDFPTTTGAYDTSLGGGRDAFVVKLSPTGETLLYSTFLGGSSWDYGYCIDAENDANVYVGGFTHGSFPVTAGAAQETFGGMGDGYVAKLNLTTNNLVYATYLGGQYWEPVDAIIVQNGIAYLTGHTQSPNFPVTQDALDNVNTVPGPNQGADGYFTKLSADGSTFLYSTFVGPENSPLTTAFSEMTLDASGNVYLVGVSGEQGFTTTAGCIQPTYGGGSSDGVVVKLNATYDSIAFSTFLGGDGLDRCTDVTLDVSGNIWVVGYTNSSQFPDSASSIGMLDVYTAYLSSDGGLLWSNRFGGTQDEGIDYVSILANVAPVSNALCVGGRTASNDYPVTADALQPNFGGGSWDNVVSFIQEPAATNTPTPTYTATPTPTQEYAWEDDFNGGTPGEQPVYWDDDTQNSGFNAEIEFSQTASLAKVTRTADDTWGKVLTTMINCDVDTFPMVQVKVSGVEPNTSWKVGLQETEGVWHYWNLSSSSTETGTFAYNYKEVTAWTGIHSFSVVLIVEGGEGSAIEADFVRVSRLVATATPTYTPTVTPTPIPSSQWNEIFNFSDDNPPSSAGDQPLGWYDETNDGNFNAEIAYASSDGLAEVSAVSGEQWGKVLSYSQSVDLASYPRLEVVISDIPQGTAKIAVFSQESGWEEFVLSPSLNTPGTYTYDLPTATGWSGVKNFGVELISEGGTAVFDSIISRAAATATPTPTAIPTNAYLDDFLGTSGEQPAGWRDESTDYGFNAHIAYSMVNSLAGITRTADSTWGKILSPIITCDTSVYTHVEIQVSRVLASTAWKIGIQEEGGAWQYWDLNSSHTQSGTFAYDYAAVTGWTGARSFMIQITTEGSAGAGLEVDWVRVCQEETVTGSAFMGVDIEDHTPTFTTTPTMTPTMTPTLVVETATPIVSTSTPTPTATPTPWLAPQKVMSYPNPARGQVNFAYTVNGSARVNIDIYKLTGERVASISEHVNGGNGQTLSTAWDAIDVAPGIYIARIRITDSLGRVVLDQRKKIALIK